MTFVIIYVTIVETFSKEIFKMTDLKDINFSDDDFVKKNTSQKTPKEMLIAFVKETSGTNKEFSFKISGDKHEAKKYIHRMRVELSRLRQKIINQDKKPIPFKIFKKDIFFDNGISEIFLTRGEEKPLSREMENLLESISVEHTPRGQE